MVTTGNQTLRKEIEINMAKQTVYLVESCGGAYEEKWQSPEGVFDSFDKALGIAKEICRKYIPEKDSLPMTLEEYRDCNYGHPEYDDNHPDDDDEYYEAFIDRDGHTKKEFEIMSKYFDLSFVDFSYCEITKLNINEPIDYNEKRTYITINNEDKFEIS